jgi:hypothetical protein
VGAGCGGESPTEFCKDYAKVTCARAFECYDAQTRGSSTFIDQYGSSEDKCNQKLINALCSAVNDSRPCVDPNKSYHGDKAEGCVDDLRSASCATITAHMFASDNCDAICS